MARTGRPRKEINKDEFEKLCGMQCTEIEICDWFGVCEDTLNKWCKKTYRLTFSEVFRQKRNLGHISLRRNQWQMAEKSVPMAIWLGKQYLGQKEYPDEFVDMEDSGAYFAAAELNGNADDSSRIRR